MDKYDYIESIYRDIIGTTGIKYQDKIGEILKIVYRDRNKTYEMPRHYGGDDKNDGWVVEDEIFYQIFAPVGITNSLKKNIQKKYKEDLDGLLEKIIVEKRWGEKISDFIFIVNTADTNLPHDSERFFENCTCELQKKYNTSFEYKLVNSDYIRNILKDLSIESLKEVSSILHVKNTIDYDGITEKTIIDTIGTISGKLQNLLFFPPKEDSYKRISSSKKIDINDLNDRKNEIEGYISMLNVVEESIEFINQDILFENKFERVKQAVIDKYSELSKTLSGIELYDTLIDDILKFLDHKETHMHPTKLIVTYIFDKCDIFEKE